MNIVLVDDHALFLEGLRNLLEAGGYPVLGVAHDGRKALELARELHPDVILMDIRMPIMDGLTATRLIKTELPQTQIVILTTSAEEADLFEAIKSGANGYLLKNMLANELFNFLAGLERGEAPISRELSSSLLREFSRQAGALEHSPSNGRPPVNLTGRQREILELVSRGMTYKEIAEFLDMSEHTVKYHMREILHRLHLKNREQVVTYAMRTGLVQDNTDRSDP
jgi:DNA-binding NarL/FixJ family response regulator